MYQINKPTKTSINTNGNGTTFIGQSIEEKMRRIVENKEPIEKAMPIIYTPSNEEVQPAYNIRTDKWEVAIDAMQRIYENKKQDYKAKQEALKELQGEQKEIKEEKPNRISGLADRAAGVVWNRTNSSGRQRTNLLRHW